MLTIIVNVEVKPDRVQDFIKATKKSQFVTMQEEGCLVYNIFQNIGDSNKFTLVEEYTSETEFEKHKTTPHFQEWRNDVFDMVIIRTSYKNITI